MTSKIPELPSSTFRKRFDETGSATKGQKLLTEIFPSSPLQRNDN